MPKPFDAALKELIVSHPRDWLEQLGVPIPAPPEVLSADLSTVTAAADVLLKVGELVVHIDVESGPDPERAQRMLLYNVLAHRHTKLPVRSIVVLLRSNANDTASLGCVEYAPVPGVSDLRFRFETVRAWEIPAEDMMRAGVGFLPLAVLGKPPAGRSREQALPELVERIAERADREAKEGAGTLLTTAFLLATMHVDAVVAKSIFQRVKAMEESGGYQLILEEGALKYGHRIVLNLGRERFGEPSEKQKNKLLRIEDTQRLERIIGKVHSAANWDALLRTK